jgi:hypothetical protein
MIKFDFSNVIVPFGKHKNQTIEDIPSGYLAWLRDNCELETIQQAAEAELQWRGDNNAHFFD